MIYVFKKLSRKALLLLGGLLGGGRGGRLLGSGLGSLSSLSGEGGLLGSGLLSVALTSSLVARADSLSLITIKKMGSVK